MARNDGRDRTCVRNINLADTAVGNTQAHNEREKASYVNQDIVHSTSTSRLPPMIIPKCSPRWKKKKSSLPVD